MLAALGIMACGPIAAIVSACATVIAAGVTTGVTIWSQKEQERAQDDMRRMQSDELDKQKKQAKADKLIQEKLVDRNLIEAKGQLGSAILTQRLIADRNRLKAARESAKANGLDGSSFNKATYSTGTPAQEA